MGLGLFIAKTSLERTGVELRFFNGSALTGDADARPTRSGAVVEAAWPLERIEVMRGRALGANKALQRQSLAATKTRKRRGFANF